MMDASAVWNGQDPTLSVSSQDDFQQFLDMGGMNNIGEGLPFEFQDFSTSQGQGQQMMNQDEGESMDTTMENGRPMMLPDTTMQDQMPAMTTAANHSTILGPPLTHGHTSSESLSELDAQINFLQQQRHHQQQRQIQEQQRNFYAQQRMGVPPTPQSMEMHPNNAQYYQQHSDSQQQAIYERYRMQVKEQQEMAFTPLVSPAVTPLEAHFSIPEYTVPGAYFSPLSSPALHAQTEHQNPYDSRQHSGNTNSPIDLNLDPHSAPGSSSIIARKSSKKSLQQKPRNTRAVRQSPIVKPRKGKKGSSNTIAAQTLGDILEPSNTHVAHPKEASVSTEESENGSISPEHLSDMAPPPVPTPGSAGRSPYIQAQNHAVKGTTRTQQLVLGSPATPASLMRLAASPNGDQPLNGHNNMDIDDSGMDGFALPEAATSRPQLSRLDTLSDGQITPTLSSAASKTPGFQPLPSPAFARPRTAASASQSPQIDAMNGSNGVNGNSRKGPPISGRNSKKRSSSSILASPALLPRISPSIKPLLPGGGKVSEDTASLLLASKSNYQNILEGTHLPGVSYPTELSTNLTSKRTSHKIAEQGRRNRINSALQEIATLLPRGPTKDSGGEKSGSGDGGESNEPTTGKGTSQSANSKASTVEQAIEYIRQLKSDLAKKDAENLELKTKVSQLEQIA